MTRARVTPLDVAPTARGFSDPVAHAARSADRPGVPLAYLDNAATTQRPRQVIQRDRRHLRTALRQRASRHPLAERSEHRPVRRSPRQGAGLHRRQPARGSDLHARHDREHQSGGPQLGRRQPATRRRDPADGDGAPLEHRALAAGRRAHRRRRALSADHRRRAVDPRRARHAAQRRAPRSWRSPPFRTCWARSIRSTQIIAAAHRGRRAGAGRRGAKRAAPGDRRAGAGRRLSGLQRPQDARADRRRRAVWPPRAARSDAALSWAAAA